MLQSIRHDEMTDICHLVKDTEKKVIPNNNHDAR